MHQRPRSARPPRRAGALQRASEAQVPPGLSVAAEIERIEGLAERVERLTISRTDPHRFFEEKDEIAKNLRALARERVFRQ